MAQQLALRDKLIPVGLIALSLTILVCFVSQNVADRLRFRPDVVAEQVAILHGGAKPVRPEIANRILAPVMLEGIAATGVPILKAFTAVRLGTALLMFLTFAAVVVPAARSWRSVALGGGMLAMAAILTFNFPWEHPTDFPDVIFTLLFIALTVSGRWLAVLLVTIVASANRESALYAGVIWVCVHWMPAAAFKELVRGGAITAAAAITVALLRFAFGGQSALSEGIGMLHNPIALEDFFLHPTPLAWPSLLLATALPIAIWLRASRNRFTELERRLCYAALAVGVVTFIFGYLNEIRIYLPMFTILIYVATIVDGRRADGRD